MKAKAKRGRGRGRPGKGVRRVAARLRTAAAPGATIEHVIVLMLENRSFDTMLGRTFNPKQLPPAGQAAYVLPVDPDHSHLGTMWGLLGKKPAGMPVPIGPLTMGGFAAAFADKINASGAQGAAPTDVLRSFTKAQLPVLTTLAEEFAVCERWFCSLPGETWPNRNFAHAATSDGEVNINTRFYTNRTIFEVLEEAGCEWRIYHSGPPQTWAFPRLWSKPWRNRFGGYEELIEEIHDDALPQYGFVEPDHGLVARDWLGRSNSQHPANNMQSGRDFVAGEALIQKIYMALVARPEVWRKTLFVITYDEHGGFYDHVPPPLDVAPAVAPDAAGAADFKFNLLGPRVPTVLVSPWIPRGTRDQTVYEHSSIPRTLRGLFAPKAAPLNARDRVAESFLRNVSLPKARADVPTIGLAQPLAPLRAASRRRTDPEETPPVPLDGFQESLVELTGMVDEELRGEGRDALEAMRRRAAGVGRRGFTTEGERARYVQDVVMRFRAMGR